LKTEQQKSRKMKTRTLIFQGLMALAIASLLLAGCGKSWHRIVGNNNVQEELRIMPPFNRIVNEGSFNVYLIQDSVNEVLIEAESNLIPYIRTVIKGNTLEISTRENLRPHYPVNLYIRTPEILGVALSGSGLIRAEEMLISPELELSLSGSGDIDLDAEASFIGVSISGSGSANMEVYSDLLIATITGSGDMEFSGETHKSELTISGSGKFRAYNMVQNECIAQISGSGDMFLHVLEKLDVAISGSGSVYYMGNPEVKTNITGSGSVIKQ
jgi:hypothetical protein